MMCGRVCLPALALVTKSQLQDVAHKEFASEPHSRQTDPTPRLSGVLPTQCTSVFLCDSNAVPITEVLGRRLVSRIELRRDTIDTMGPGRP